MWGTKFLLECTAARTRDNIRQIVEREGDKVVAREDLPKVLGQILSMLMGGKRRAA